MAISSNDAETVLHSQFLHILSSWILSLLAMKKDSRRNNLPSNPFLSSSQTYSNSIAFKSYINHLSSNASVIFSYKTLVTLIEQSLALIEQSWLSHFKDGRG